MHFRIADTFTDSLARLTGDEQKAVKTTAFDLQVNPAQPSLSFHKLEKAKDRHFWSVRVSRDVRIIVHKTDSSLLLCYVDHHDRAYAWAERRKLETHPTTGAAQLVEIRERVQEIVVPTYVHRKQPVRPKPPLFLGVQDGALLSYGVPREWLHDVRNATEDSLLDLTDHLPSEAAEALLELATGGTPRSRSMPPPVIESTRADEELLVDDRILDAPSLSEADSTAAFAHPDAQRRFRAITNSEELAQALAFPWEKWRIFLHPEQREWVEREFNGPARVSGSAGTGKTIVALHRAVHLARQNPDARVLLATFSEALANALKTQVRRLTGDEPHLGERLEVHSMNAIGERLYELHFGRPKLATRDRIRELLSTSAADVGGLRFSPQFLLSEWEDVVDAWQLDSWETYRDVARLGRKTRLAESQRKALWSVFEKVRAALAREGLQTYPSMFRRLTTAISGRKHPPFDFAVVDESQDVRPSQLLFLSAMGGGRPNALFFAGDLGQRIFQQPFSWKSLGVEIRGRSRTLHVNYRTSHQIRTQADRLLGPDVSDIDGNSEDRRHTISTFNGPPAILMMLGSEQEEVEAVGSWLFERMQQGALPHEIAIIVRSDVQMPRAQSAVERTRVPFVIVDEKLQSRTSHISLCTMHVAKGLEFRGVAVMACDDEVIPLQSRIESVTEDSDLEEVYNTERHLLYVACTRARDHLLITGVVPVSEFLDDISPAAAVGPDV